MDRFPDAAGDEVAENGNIGIGDMIVANSPIAAVADVIFREEVLFIEVPLGAVS